MPQDNRFCVRELEVGGEKTVCGTLVVHQVCYTPDGRRKGDESFLTSGTPGISQFPITNCPVCGGELTTGNTRPSRTRSAA